MAASATEYKADFAGGNSYIIPRGSILTRTFPSWMRTTTHRASAAGQTTRTTYSWYTGGAITRTTRGSGARQQRLEPDGERSSRPVLRGLGSGNGTRLPDICCATWERPCRRWPTGTALPHAGPRSTPPMSHPRRQRTPPTHTGAPQADRSRAGQPGLAGAQAGALRGSGPAAGGWRIDQPHCRPARRGAPNRPALAASRPHPALDEAAPQQRARRLCRPP